MNSELFVKKLEAIEYAKSINGLMLTFRYEDRNRNRENNIIPGHPKWALFYRAFARLLSNKVLWPLVSPELYPGHEGLPFFIPAQKLEDEECMVRISNIKISVNEDDFDLLAVVDFEHFSY